MRRVGCASVLLVAVVAFAGAVCWAVAPGSQVPSARVIGPDTIGYAHLRDLSGDPGAEALILRALAELVRVESEVNEEGIGDWIERARGSSAVGAPLMDLILPREATLVLEPGPRNRSTTVTALNLRHFTRPAAYFAEPLADWLLERDHGTLLAANESEGLRQGLVRLSGDGPEDHVSQRIERLSKRWHLHGWLSPNLLRRGSIAAGLIGTGLIDGIELGLSVLSEDALEGEITLDATDGDAAAGLAPALRLVLLMAAGQAAAQGLSLEHRQSQEGDRIVVELDLRGLDRFIEVWADSLIAERVRD